MNEEEYLLEQLRLLQEEYQKLSKQYIDRLIFIRMGQPIKPMFIPKDSGRVIND